MKRMIFIIVSITCLFITLPVQAQLLKFGVRGGLNVSKVTFSENLFKGDNRMGFYIGPMAEITIPLAGLGLDVAALYNQTEAESEGFGSNLSEISEKMRSIEIPVNLKWTVGLGSTLGVYVAAGPQFGFNVGDGDYARIFDMKTYYTSFNIGGGVKLLSHLQAGINYNFVINKLANGIYDKTGDSIEMKRKNWQFSLTYIF